MFVSIRDIGSDNRIMYDCSKCSCNSYINDDSSINKNLIYLHFTSRDGKTFDSHVISKEGTQVYFMNDEGKTIDYMGWTKTEPNDLGEPVIPALKSKDERFISIQLKKYNLNNDYIGWYEPEDKSWILFIDKNNMGIYFGTRNKETGAIIT